MGCPIHYAMSIVGDKWSLVIVRDLMFGGKKYYGDFARSGEGIASNILADRLKKLEANAIITKRQDPNNLCKYIYSLTDKGLDLMPVLFSLIEWIDKHYDQFNIPPGFLAELRRNKDALEEKIRKQLKAQR